MSSFKFSVDTPAAKRLIALTFEKLKEIWDPDAKDAVAIYAVALAAKGWERKKVFGKLVELLKPDDACNMLLDWLLPYIKKHRNELLAEPAPLKVAAAPPAKAEPAVKSEQAPQPSHAATASAAAAPLEEAPVDDVEALLQEELPSDMMTDLEDEPLEQQQEGWASDASPNQQPEQQAEAAPILRTSSSGQRLASQKSEEAPGAHAKEDGRRGRMKSVIQWSAPVPGEQARQPGTKESRLAPELAARRARFLGQAGTSDAPAAETAAGKGRERTNERDRGAERERERDNGRRAVDRPLDIGRRGSRDGDHDRPGPTAGRRSRSRSPPGPRGARERDRERIREPGGWGRDEAHRDGHPHDRRDHPSDRRRQQATAPAGHPDGPHVEWGRNGPPGRHDEPWNGERPHPLSPPGEASRQRLRSTVSGGLDGAEEGGAAGGRAAAGAAAGRGLGISRLLQGALVSTSLASRISKPRAVLRGRLGADAEGQLEEGEAPPVMGREAQVGARAAASRARAAGDGEEEAGERPKSIFERLARGNAVAPAARPRSTGSKRHAPSIDDTEEPSEDMNGNAADRTKAQRTEVTRRMGSAVLSAPRSTAQPAAAAAQPAAAAPSQAAATAAAAAATAGLRAKVAAQVPLLPGGVKPALPRQASLAASTVAQARVRQAAQQQAAAAATGAAGPSQVAKPAAAAVAARPVAVNIMGQPVGAAAKTNGAAAAAVNPAQAQMALIKEELRRKALEIERIKGQIALQEVLADQGTPDSRSIFVQGLHPHVSKELLAEFFRQCGAVVNVNIIFDPMTQMVCGAYVEFGQLDAQARALALDRRKFMDQVLIVKPKPIKQAPPPRAAPAAFNASAGARRLADAAPLPGKVAKTSTWTRAVPQPVVNQ